MQTIQLTRRLPDERLRPFVLGYTFVADLAGTHDGSPITTTPHTAAVISLNIGRPAVTDFAAGAPRSSLLGIQSHVRRYHPQPGTYLVMIMVSLPGLVRLFPDTGAAADDMIDLTALLGDGTARYLLADVAAAWTPDRIARRLDDWLLRRLYGLSQPAHAPHVHLAWETLRATGRVDLAANAAGVSIRQFERWFARHVGHGPKALVGIDRLQASVRAIQTGGHDPLDGYSDQAHQIRAWRRHVGVTPGHYRQQPRSFMADAFQDDALSHFL